MAIVQAAKPGPCSDEQIAIARFANREHLIINKSVADREKPLGSHIGGSDRNLEEPAIVVADPKVTLPVFHYRRRPICWPTFRLAIGCEPMVSKSRQSNSRAHP